MKPRNAFGLQVKRLGAHVEPERAPLVGETAAETALVLAARLARTDLVEHAAHEVVHGGAVGVGVRQRHAVGSGRGGRRFRPTDRAGREQLPQGFFQSFSFFGASK